MKYLFLFLFTLQFINLNAQIGKYWVFIDEKIQNFEQNSLAISPLAQAKRYKKKIPLEYTDYKLSDHYLDQLSKLGLDVVYQSRWLRAYCIIIKKESQYEQLIELPFVKRVSLMQRLISKKEPLLHFSANSKNNRSIELEPEAYGYGQNQIEMLNGITLHNLGFRGEGITIGVFDNGFSGVDTLDVFDSLRNQNRIIGTYDFVQNNDSVYDSGDHGTMVLSTMASLLTDSLIGTAPKANYYLFVTEDNTSESKLEEVNWLKAIEYADSVGVDVTNTSLGYTVFDEEETSYSYADMDGNTAIITKAADMAAKKGMLIINSAGNSGNDDWYYIGAPADGDSVLAIGAVNGDEEIVGFSSRGPSADGRIKPNVCAQGAGSAVVSPNNKHTFSNGTSFSGPILAGMAACLWQSNLSKSNMAIFDAIQESAHQFDNPDNDYGYGIPDFMRADSLLKSDTVIYNSEYYRSQVLPVPFVNDFTIYFISDKMGQVEIEVYDMTGRLIYQSTPMFYEGRNSHYIQQSSHWINGVYFIKVIQEGLVHPFKTIKL